MEASEIFMTKYEPQSYSKRDMDGKKISRALVVSNSGSFAAPSGKELRVTKPYEPIKANGPLF